MCIVWVYLNIIKKTECVSSIMDKTKIYFLSLIDWFCSVSHTVLCCCLTECQSYPGYSLLKSNIQIFSLCSLFIFPWTKTLNNDKVIFAWPIIFKYSTLKIHRIQLLNFQNLFFSFNVLFYILAQRGPIYDTGYSNN